MSPARRTRRWLNLTAILAVAMLFCAAAWRVWRVPDAREVMLKRNLYSLRQAIEVFQAQHAGKYPAARTRTSQEFHDQMLLPSNRAGETAPTPRPGYWFGPYFAGQLPANPLSGAREVWVVDEKVAVVPDERIEVRVCDRWHRAGWIYSPNSGRIRPNSGGRSSEGIRWYEF